MFGIEIVLLGIILSLTVQGWLVMNELFGYKKYNNIPSTNDHPEMLECKPGDKLLVAKFEDYNFIKLRERINKKKMEELFEEPSTYEDEDELH